MSRSAKLTRFDRHEKSLSRSRRVSQPHRSARHISSHHLPVHDTLCHIHRTLLPPQATARSAITHMDSDPGFLLRNGCLRAWMVRSRTSEELDEPASWHWSGDLCHDHFSNIVWIVHSWKGEEEDSR